MQQKQLALILFGLIFILVSMNTVVFADVVVITNDSVTDNLDREDIKNIFLGKKKYWDNDQAIVFFILKESPAHKEFVQKYLGKTESQYNYYWKQLLFTGRGMMPERVSEKELGDLIQKTKGAIGYLPTAVVPNGAKVTTIE